MAAKLSPPIAQDPPTKLVNRTARVATGITNSIRVPHDRFFDETSQWYTAGDNTPVVPGNQVKYLVYGSEAFPEMQDAIDTATGPDHFIYMLNWFCDVDFDLTTGEAKEPGDPKSGNTRRKPVPNTLRYVLANVADRGVMIRAMFYQFPFQKTGFIGDENSRAAAFLNSWEHQMTVNGLQPVRMTPPLRNSAAILDNIGDDSALDFFNNIPILSIIGDVPRAIGSQHQKMLCVFGEQGLVCFCGGIDWNPDRVCQPGGSPSEGTPLHDVHCRIAGPGAMELTKTFALRWYSHPRVQDRLKNSKHPERYQLITPSKPAEVGQHFVQVGRTFRKGNYKWQLPGYATIPAAGEFTASAMIVKAIGQAQRYIYTECQYFTGDPAEFGGSAQLENALKAAISTIDHLTIVVTHWEISDLPSVNHHRLTFFQNLMSAGRDKVRIFTLQPEGDTAAFKAGKNEKTYVHAKIWIMDDEFAVIGSVNSNRRSWLHDSEVAAGIYETSTDAVLHYRLAHKFRIKLWAEHLSMPEATGEAELADGVASSAHWLRRMNDARIRPYDLNDHGDIKPALAFLWNGALDPSN